MSGWKLLLGLVLCAGICGASVSLKMALAFMGLASALVAGACVVFLLLGQLRRGVTALARPRRVPRWVRIFD